MPASGRRSRPSGPSCITLRSTKWALLITFVGAIAVTFLATHGARHQPGEAAAQGFDPTNTALAGLALGSLVVGILGILSMTGEYGSGTIRSSLAATPRRGVFFGAKVIVMGVFALAVGLVVSFLSFFEGQAILSGAAPTATLGDPNVLGALLGSAGFLALGALFGLGIGAIIRHSAGAIATFVGMHPAPPRPAAQRAREPRSVHARDAARELRRCRRARLQRLVRPERLPPDGALHRRGAGLGAACSARRDA